MSFRAFLDDTGPLDGDALVWAKGREEARKEAVWIIQRDLFKLAKDLGQTNQQAITKVDQLFSTFAAEWAIFVLTGSDSINDAIQNDATIAWLDTDVSGQTIRQRLLNRLS